MLRQGLLEPRDRILSERKEATKSRHVNSLWPPCWNLGPVLSGTGTESGSGKGQQAASENRDMACCKSLKLPWWSLGPPGALLLPINHQAWVPLPEHKGGEDLHNQWGEEDQNGYIMVRGGWRCLFSHIHKYLRAVCSPTLTNTTPTNTHL